MTRLWSILLLFVLLLGLSALAWQVLQRHQHEIRRLHQNQQSLIQQLGDLNDRLVAVSRMQSRDAAFAVQRSVPPAEQASLLRNNLRHALILAQAALQDGRIHDAEVLLLQVQSVLADDQQALLAPALVDALSQAVQADRVQLAQSAQLRQTARQSMDLALSRIQTQLDQMAQRGPVLYASPAATKDDASDGASSSWPDRISAMVSVQRVDASQQLDLAQRALICREVSLTLGLARHAIRQQQADQVNALLREASRQLQRLPDAEAVQVNGWLHQLLSHPIPAPLQLDALALLPERPAS
ncbi:MAG: hypothetical protein VXW65_13825 [Pseudomonadota bacterium]|nr:hypothetical protein [Pseudomonadota bacterium]